MEDSIQVHLEQDPPKQSKEQPLDMKSELKELKDGLLKNDMALQEERYRQNLQNILLTIKEIGPDESKRMIDLYLELKRDEPERFRITMEDTNQFMDFARKLLTAEDRLSPGPDQGEGYLRTFKDIPPPPALLPEDMEESVLSQLERCILKGYDISAMEKQIFEQNTDQLQQLLKSLNSRLNNAESLKKRIRTIEPHYPNEARELIERLKDLSQVSRIESEFEKLHHDNRAGGKKTSSRKSTTTPDTKDPRYAQLNQRMFDAFERQDLKRALGAANRILKHYPEDPITWSSRGVILRRMNNIKGAIRSYKKALAMDPDHVDSLYNLGYAYLSLKKAKIAKKYFKRVLSLQSDHDLAMDGLRQARAILKR